MSQCGRLSQKRRQYVRSEAQCCRAIVGVVELAICRMKRPSHSRNLPEGEKRKEASHCSFVGRNETVPQLRMYREAERTIFLSPIPGVVIFKGFFCSVKRRLLAACADGPEQQLT